MKSFFFGVAVVVATYTLGLDKVFVLLSDMNATVRAAALAAYEAGERVARERAAK